VHTAGLPHTPQRLHSTFAWSRILVLSCLLHVASTTRAQETACPPPGYDRAALRELRAQHFKVADDAARQKLALSLLACLASPDSELRDKIGYEAYAYWRSGKSLSAATWSGIEQALRRVLDAPGDDPRGVTHPFAALVLAEVVHADRNEPFLDAQRRLTLLDSAIRYVEGVRDYRGFDDDVGWRHGVAHGADLLGQLARESSLGRRELDRILAALATQIFTRDDSVYVFGESERLAAAVAAVAQRHLLSADDWKGWIARVAAPAPLPGWADAWQSRKGLARRQNTMNFLLALYAEFGPSDDEALRALAAPVAAAMQPLR